MTSICQIFLLPLLIYIRIRVQSFSHINRLHSLVHAMCGLHCVQNQNMKHSTQPKPDVRLRNDAWIRPSTMWTLQSRLVWNVQLSFILGPECIAVHLSNNTATKTDVFMTISILDCSRTKQSSYCMLCGKSKYILRPRELEFWELERTFTIGHIPQILGLYKTFLSECLCVCIQMCVCACKSAVPPVAPSCHPTPGACGCGHGWSTMWELVPAGGVKRPPDGIKKYHRGTTQTHTYANKHPQELQNTLQRTCVFPGHTQWCFHQNAHSGMSIVLIGSYEFSLLSE